MENISPPSCNNSELQALIAAIPHDLSITSASKTNSSLGDLSSTSSSCIFPQFNDINAISSMWSLTGGYPTIFNGFPVLSTFPYLGGTHVPPHATIESLGLINSSLYHQQRDVQSAMCSPSSSSSSTVPSTSQFDTRPRAFSSAATLQHVKPERRKRSRKSEILPSSSTTSPSGSSSTNNNNSLLRSLVEDDDIDLPNKVRPIRVTKEEEEMVRQKTQELLKSVPIHVSQEEEKDEECHDDRRPLRRLIRDEDLPDVVGPDSPFRHYPKYQPRSSTQLVMLQGIQAAVARLCVKAFELGAKSEHELAELRRTSKGQSLEDLVNETIRQELIVAE